MKSTPCKVRSRCTYQVRNPNGDAMRAPAMTNGRFGCTVAVAGRTEWQ